MVVRAGRCAKRLSVESPLSISCQRENSLLINVARRGQPASPGRNGAPSCAWLSLSPPPLRKPGSPGLGLPPRTLVRDRRPGGPGSPADAFCRRPCCQGGGYRLATAGSALLPSAAIACAVSGCCARPFSPAGLRPSARFHSSCFAASRIGKRHASASAPFALN